MSITLPVADVLYRPEIVSRLIRYLAQDQRTNKRMRSETLRRLSRHDRDTEKLMTLRRRLSAKTVAALEAHRAELIVDVRLYERACRQLRDVLYQIEVLQKVAKPGRRPRRPPDAKAEQVPAAWRQPREWIRLDSETKAEGNEL